MLCFQETSLDLVTQNIVVSFKKKRWRILIYTDEGSPCSYTCQTQYHHHHQNDRCPSIYLPCSNVSPSSSSSFHISEISRPHCCLEKDDYPLSNFSLLSSVPVFWTKYAIQPQYWATSIQTSTETSVTCNDNHDTGIVCDLEQSYPNPWMNRYFIE